MEIHTRTNIPPKIPTQKSLPDLIRKGFEPIWFQNLEKNGILINLDQIFGFKLNLVLSTYSKCSMDTVWVYIII